MKALKIVLALILIMAMIPAFAFADNGGYSKIEAEIAANSAIETELKKATEGKAVDFNHLILTYQTELEEAVKAVDPKTDEVIQFALQAGKSGQLDALVVRQLVLKTLQKFFYQATAGLLKTNVVEKFNDKAAAKALFADAKAYYEGILKSTVEKRDQSYSIDMVGIIDLALEKMEASIEDQDLTEFQVGRQIYEKTLIRTFYLAVDTYSKKFPIADQRAAKASQAEGWAFYQSIVGSLSGSDPVSGGLINTRFSIDQPTSAINHAEIEKLFARAFIAKTNGYLGKTIESMTKEEYNKAAITAMEGNTFLTSLELPVKNKLGAAVSNQAMVDAEAYYNAVRAKDTATAKTEADKVAKVLQKLEASLTDKLVFTTGTKEFALLGKTMAFDAATYVKNGRTYVPVRVLENLGAEVKWNPQTSEATVSLAGKVIVAKIGSKDIIVNGSAIQSDVATELTDGRTFVPVRVISEQLGLNVAWNPNNQQVIVN